MKGDFTRNTFRKKKHYRRVNKQQGRVDVDADWNEQVGIEIHHERTSLRDVIGESGAPSENPGFKIIPTTGSGYKIGSGRYYVDGILCENEDDLDAKDQPDLPVLEGLKYPYEPQVYAFPTEAGGMYLVYLHVWERHLTAIDDHYIRESALGGPDTATRTKVVWQVQLLRIGGKTRGSIVAKARANVPPNLPLAIKQLISEPDEEDTDPEGIRKILLVPREGGKSGVIEVTDPHAKEKTINLNIRIGEQNPTKLKAIETEVNGVFRVNWSIFRRDKRFVNFGEGQPVRVGPFKDKDVVIATYSYESDEEQNLSCSSQIDNWDKLVETSSGKLQARSEPESIDTVCMIPPQAKYTGLENQLYRVEIHDAGVVGSNAGTSLPPTFNWSRDNGIVVTRIKKIVDSTMTVTNPSKDRNLHFLPQQWVEVTDDRHELWGIPGSMVKIDDIQGNDLLFDPATLKGESITENYFQQNQKYNPKVRRWDNNGEKGPIEVKFSPEKEDYINLESGVQVKFGEGRYHTGDYWLIPARTMKRDIEWPQTETGPEALAPEGIEHHFTRLAILKYTGNSVELISDCRKFFPPAIDRTCAATITTGIIIIKGTDLRDLEGKEFNFGPFKHGIENTKTPPAIVIGKIPLPSKPPNTLNGIPVEDRSRGDTIENYVSFMEDRGLYEFNKDPYDPENASFPLFKAVGINLKTFRINIKHKPNPVRDLVLRFWAISAGMQVDPQVGPSPP